MQSKGLRLLRLLSCTIIGLLYAMMVANVASFICFNRKKLSCKSKSEYRVSVNMAYGEVALKSMAGEMDGREYI